MDIDDLPGELIMWILIVSELLIFAAGITAMMAMQLTDPPGFAAARAMLDGRMAALNTVVLVTSGLFAARAERAAGAGDRRGARGALMLAALKAMKDGPEPPVDVYWLFTISEEVGHGAASILLPDVASMVAVDNGTSAPGQNSSEFGVTISMADMTGPFDYHLTQKLVNLCRANDIRFRKDIFRYYRSDSASAIEAGADVRTALVTFGIDASHGYERIHMHSLRSVAELLTAHALSEVEITRDFEPVGPLEGFTKQSSEPAGQALTALKPPPPRKR